MATLMATETQALPYGADALFRQHFTDFYGDLSEDELQRLIQAEQMELADVAERCYHQSLLRSWRDGVDGPAALTILGFHEPSTH
jgi:hypothetical protein